MASEYPVWGFGVLPLNPFGWGNAGLHGAVEEIHEFAFNMTILMSLVHLTFHIWRHVRLHDNALRIMTPKFLHRFL